MRSKLTLLLGVLALLAGGLGMVAGATTAQAESYNDLYTDAISGTMTYDEWVPVHSGESKKNVNDSCNCSGKSIAYKVVYNGNNYWEWKYLSKVGTAFIFYRWGSDDHWHVGWQKFWCPGWTQDVISGDCESTFT